MEERSTLSVGYQKLHIVGGRIQAIGKFLFLLLAVSVFLSNSSLFAVGRLGCLGAGMAEYLVPGLGYALTKQWDKAIFLGGARWIASNHVYVALDSGYYQDDSDEIYKYIDADESESGKYETKVYLNKETWTGRYYSSMYADLLLTTWGDLYQHGCRPNTETYSLMLSPFRVNHFYNKWAFWVPLAFLVGNSIYFSGESQVDFYLKRGLKSSDLEKDSFSQLYMVGVGEEMFFRGTVQHYFFELMKDSWDFSPFLSRHLSVVGASAVFAAAHDGAGFSTNPFGAFLFGIYEGYFIYHPSLNEFDLTTAIALHSWWDIIVAYSIFNNADFHESQNIRIPIFSIGFEY